MTKQGLAARVKVKVLGILGGSGLYEASFFDKASEKIVRTPFGEPSDRLQIGEVDELRVAFIPRHGRTHTIPANLINHRANIHALRREGVTHILASSSTGSLKKNIKPGEFLVPDDFLGFWDIPTLRQDVHYATPVLDSGLRRVLKNTATKAGATVHDGGTYIQTSGPRLETKAEIRFFKDYGDVLGMTMASEATLACEVDIRYASLCTVDNYCNGITSETLTYEEIVRRQKGNAGTLDRAMRAAVELLA
jgi:5'-methylthioadenosine phosphorylase